MIVLNVKKGVIQAMTRASLVYWDFRSRRMSFDLSSMLIVRIGSLPMVDEEECMMSVGRGCVNVILTNYDINFGSRVQRMNKSILPSCSFI